MIAAVTIARFEVRQRLRRLSTWIYFGVFFALGVVLALAAGGAFAGAAVNFGGGTKVWVNAPYAIHMVATLIGLFGTVFIAAIAGQATFQDVDHGVTALFFTAPIRKLHYLGGRFAGAFIVCAIIYSAIGLGLALGLHLPVLDAARLGPSPGVLAYLGPYAVALGPNLLITVALFFSLATLSRRMMPVYAGSVVLLLGYMIALGLADDVENKTLTSLADPFGMIATDRITEYWTVIEKNGRRVPLAGVLLANRLLWGAIALGLLVFTAVRFSFSTRTTRRPKELAASPAVVEPTTIPIPQLDFSRRTSFGLVVKLARLQWRETVKSVIFLVLLLAGCLFMATTAPSVGRIFGTKTWPVTANVLETLGGSFQLFILAIVTFYSGELVWRERDADLAQIYDALPTPRWVTFVSKWLALLGVEVVLLLVIFLAGLVLQTVQGYHHHELGLYARWLFAHRLVDLAFLSTLAFFVHVVVNHKYTGHFAMTGYYVVAILLPQLGIEHRLFRPGSQPDWMYSDMNGFGHFVVPLVAFKVHWAAFAGLLALVTSALWVRGTESTLRIRLALARARLSRGFIAAAIGCIAVWGASGAFIYWNTNILHPYRNRFAREGLSKRYEVDYKAAWVDAAQPRVVGTKVTLALRPEVRELDVDAEMTLANKTLQPISRILFNLDEDAIVRMLALGRGERLAEHVKELGVRIYELGTPLLPGESLVARVGIDYRNRGFENGPGNRTIVANGTFVNSAQMLPSIGYNAGAELDDDDRRRKHGLSPKQRMRDLDDPRGLAENYVTHDADWITFEGTVSTSPDQTALLPGEREKTWTENGRAFSRFVMEPKVLDFWSLTSARYVVARDAWNDVAIEVYHHETHTYDVARMIRGVTAALDTVTVAFGPYQHRSVRIIEFPRYASFAQAFPGTIPYSESIGFIARVDDKADEIDYPLYVTAHEVAHQWWAHQVIGGNVQGSTLLSESFAQYSAFLVMKHLVGERSMRKFLRYELDSYLQGRGGERKKELPLMRVENQQYIHYAKGALVMWALQDALGEETVNRVLRTFLEQVKYKGPPYTNARAFVDVLRREAPSELVRDLFERITLYELRAREVRGTKLPDGRYKVVVKATAKKVHADDLGAETEAPIVDEELTFGALDEKGNAIHLEKHRVTGHDAEVRFVVDRKPAKAGIDPLNAKIDRLPDDNVMRIEGL